ncbi:hypothetical protein ABT320_01555 [Streptomyces cellulosae]
MTDRHTADTITDDALDQLYAQLAEASEQLRLVDALRQQHHDAATAAVERATRAEADLKTLGQTALGYQQRAWDAEAQLKQAQAALDRVRALAERWRYTGDRKEGPLRELRQALDEQPAPEPCDGRPCAGTGCSHEQAAAALTAHDEAAGLYTAPAPAATEATELEKTTRVFAALHHSAEEDVTRVINLYEQWAAAGPPPLGVPVARWWDARLVELHDAIRPSADQPKEQ